MRIVFLSPTSLLAAALLAGCSSSSAGNGSQPVTASDASAADSSVADGAIDAGAGDAAADGAVADALPPWAPDATDPDAAALVAARPYTLHVPKGYDASKRTPLVVMFHGFGASGAVEEAYWDLSDTSDAHGFLYAYGDGTQDKDGNRFWNATDGCCDLYGSKVDDVAYYQAIVDDVSAHYDVDPKRIYVVGHSNGGFMAHRLGCEAASGVAAVISLAGGVWIDPSKCTPPNPVSVLEIHGDADQTILYDGGSTKEGPYPAATTTVATWASKEGCTGSLAATGQTLTIDTSQPPGSTIVQAYGGCPTGVDVQLWTMQGSPHIPGLQAPAWGELLWGFLQTHAKP